jgi:hypothetical protein
MGERDYFYSTDGSMSGNGINPQIADQLRGFVPEEKGPHIEVSENPAGGLATEQTVEETKIESVVNAPISMTAEERRARSADLLTQAMDARGTDPEAVLAQADQSQFVKENDGAMSPTGELGQQILDAYEEKKSAPANNPEASATKIEKPLGDGQLRSELHNLGQQIDSARKSLDQATRDGGEKYVYDRIRELEKRQSEILAAIKEAQPKEAPKQQEIEPGVEVPPEETTPISEPVREIILTQAVADGLLKIDDKGRFAADTKEGENILRSVKEIPLASTSQVSEVNAEAPKLNESQAAESPVPSVEQVGDEPTEDTESEAPIESNLRTRPESDRTAEDVVERQALVEGRARESKTFQALEAKIADKEKIQQPAQKGFLSRAYLWVMRRDELTRYQESQQEWHEAQKELKELNNIRKTWIDRETKIFERGAEVSAEISDICGRLVSGEVNKREQAKAQKLLSKLANQRQALDVVFAGEVASRIGLENFEPIVRPVWEGIDRRPQLSENERQAEDREVFDFVDRERQAKEEAVRSLQAELTPDGLQERPEREGLAKLLEKAGLGEGEVRSLRDLSPEAQARFFDEEAAGSLAELATARAMMTAVQEQINERAESDKASENPLAFLQLYTGLRAAKLAEHQAEAQVRNAIDRVSKGESLGELKEKTVQKIKQAIGDKVFLVDGNFEVTAETRLGELALSGNSALSEVVYRGWQDWNALRIMGHRTAHGVINLRRGFNEKFAELIPESTEAARKASALATTLAEIGARSSEVSGATDSIMEIRRTALEGRRAILEAALVERDRMSGEQRQQTVDNIVEGMIDMLAVPKQSKDKLRRVYVAEDLSDQFLDTLLEYYQRSKLNLERKRQKAEAEVSALEERREWLTGIIARAADGAAEISADEIERELAEIDHEISEKVLAIQDRIDIIYRDYRAQIRNLEDQLDGEMYRAVLEKLS